MTASTAPVAAAPAPEDPAGAPAPAVRSDPVAWLTRWVVPYTMVAVVLATLVRWAARPLSNFDTYFHLRFGHEFLDGWSLRDPGRVTSYASADWVPTQWLPQVAMAAVEDRFGLAGVAWLGGLLFVGLAVTLYAGARRVADPLVAAALLVVALIGCTSGMSMRPQVISYLCVSVVVVAWQRAAERGRTPWLVVPLTWVWAMCHGMWPIGVVIGVVAVLGWALDRRRSGRALAAAAAVPALSLLTAGLLTPVGAQLLPAVLVVNSRGEFFSEWAAPDFTSFQPLVVLGLLAVALVAMLRAPRGDWTTLLLTGLAAGFLVYSQRTVPVAACMAVPLVAVQLQRLLGPRRRVRRGEVAVLGALVGTALSVLAVVVPTTSAAPPPQPRWVDSALGGLAPGTLVLDESSFGGYLMWRFPDLDFAYSGYGDIYTLGELEDMADVAHLDPGWDELVRELRPACAVLATDSPLAYALRVQEGWRVVHDDPDVQLLEPPAGWMDE